MPAPRPINVASGARPCSETVRAMIERGFAVLRKDAADPDGFLVAELFSSYGPDTAATVKKYLVEHLNIPVVLNWPREGLGIPQVAVVTSQEVEDTASDYLGDEAGLSGSGRFTSENPDGSLNELNPTDPFVQREQRGYWVKAQTDVYVRGDDPLTCIYLTRIVQLIIFMNKMELIRDVDMHNLTIDVTEIAHNPELFPEQAYTRQVTLKYMTVFDYNLPEVVIRALSLKILVNPSKLGVDSVHDEDAVEVPFTKP